MKVTKLLLILVMSISSGAILNASMNELCSEENCANVRNKSCKCYCSVKCGPREKERGDMPRWNDETDRCMCAARDERLYYKNKCDQIDEENAE